MMKFIIDKTKLTKLCEQNDIAFLGVFGSFAKGTPTPESDFDLLVRFSKRKSLLDLVRAQREFSEALGRRDIDLLTEDSISPYLKDKIKKEVKTVYRKK